MLIIFIFTGTEKHNLFRLCYTVMSFKVKQSLSLFVTFVCKMSMNAPLVLTTARMTHPVLILMALSSVSLSSDVKLMAPPNLLVS